MNSWLFYLDGSFSWANHVVMSANKVRLGMKDLIEMPDGDTCDKLIEEYELESKKGRGLLGTYFYMHFWEIMASALCQAIYIGGSIMYPLGLNWLIRDTTGPDIHYNRGVGMAFVMAGSALVIAISNQMQLHYTFHIGQRLRSLTIALIFRKALVADMAKHISANPDVLEAAETFHAEGGASAAAAAVPPHMTGNNMTGGNIDMAIIRGHTQTGMDHSLALQVQPEIVHDEIDPKELARQAKAKAKDEEKARKDEEKEKKRLARIADLATEAEGIDPVSKVLNLLANDAQQMVVCAPLINQIWSMPVTLAISIYFLIHFMDASVLIGVGIIFLLIPISGYLSYKMERARRRHLRSSDTRVAFCKELLEGIRTVKLFGWEDRFQERIDQVRGHEINMVTDFIYHFGTSVIYLVFVPAIGVGVAIIVYAALGGILDPNRIFTSIAFFTTLRSPLTSFGAVLSAGANLRVALGRMNNFWNAPNAIEVPSTDFLTNPEDELLPNGADIRNIFPPETPVVIRARKVNFTWNQPAKTHDDLGVPLKTVAQVPLSIKDLTIAVPQGSLISILGPVGSGKSTLLRGLIASVRVDSGDLFVDSSSGVAFVPQEPWIMNRTLRDNVVFGAEFDFEHYKNTIRTCGLALDLKRLAKGDASILGERGNTLSGGQRQRVALARAVYSRAAITLMDDPFSALDATTGSLIFEALFGDDGFLKKPMSNGIKPTVILVSSQNHFAEKSDWVVMLNAEGRISHQGTPHDIFNNPKTAAVAAEIIENNQQALAEQGVPVRAISTSFGAMEEAIKRVNTYSQMNLDSVVHHHPSTAHILSTASKQLGGINIQPQQSGASGALGFLAYDRANSDANLAFGATKADSQTFIPTQDPNLLAILEEDIEAVEREAAKARELEIECIIAELQDEKPPVYDAQGRLVLEDEANNNDDELGAKVSSSEVMVKYLRAIGRGSTPRGKIIAMTCVFYLAVERVGFVAADYWMSLWTRKKDPMGVASLYIPVYAGLLVIGSIAVWARTRAVNHYSIVAAVRLFEEMMKAALRAPLQFYDVTPIGRLLNRVSFDVEMVDITLINRIIPLASCIGSFLVAAAVLFWKAFPYSFAGLPPIFLLYFGLVTISTQSVEQLQKLDAATKSPLQSHTNESLAGVVSIRSYRAVQRFIDRCDILCDNNAKAVFTFNGAIRWLGIRTELFSVATTYFIAMLSWAKKDNAANTGFVMTWCFALCQCFGLFCVFVNQYQAAMVSVDRVDEYGRLPPERGRGAQFESELCPFLDYPPLTPEQEAANAAAAAEKAAREQALQDAEDEELKRTNPKKYEKVITARQNVVIPIEEKIISLCAAPKYPPVVDAKGNETTAIVVAKPPIPSHAEWPETGLLELREVWMAYRPALKPALRGCTFTAEAGERVAVVGRTGAGKSSLAAALFRTSECWSSLTKTGGIYVANAELSTLELTSIRGKKGGVCIVAQEPLVFSGTIRGNIDPFFESTDQECLDALRDVGMIQKVRGKLDFAVEDRGANFSLGEKQLVCLARALLRRPKILVLDEATASVDQASDERVQVTLRTAEAFSQCTFLTVAHRLLTIADYDKVVVMDRGRVAEVGHPHDLLTRKAPNGKEGSLFAKLVNASGESTSAAIRKIAHNRFDTTTHQRGVWNAAAAERARKQK